MHVFQNPCHFPGSLSLMDPGYGIEAVSYAIGLLQYDLIRPEDLWLTQVSGV